MSYKVTLNARNPKEDEYGYEMLDRMNKHHQKLHKWALEHISIDKASTILDIGFGGGQNIHNLLKLRPNATIYGIDYSSASLKKCMSLNEEYVKSGKVKLQIGSAESLPYSNNMFDLVIAFETIYYWPNIEKCFKNINNILKKNGVFLICNEDSFIEGNEQIAKDLNMKFYNENSLESLLCNCGFIKVSAYTNPNGKWVCAVGKK